MIKTVRVRLKNDSHLVPHSFLFVRLHLSKVHKDDLAGIRFTVPIGFDLP